MKKVKNIDGFHGRNFNNKLKDLYLNLGKVDNLGEINKKKEYISDIKKFIDDGKFKTEKNCIPKNFERYNKVLKINTKIRKKNYVSDQNLEIENLSKNNDLLSSEVSLDRIHNDKITNCHIKNSKSLSCSINKEEANKNTQS